MNPGDERLDEAWAGLLESLEKAATAVRERTAGDPDGQAEGLRFVTRLHDAMREFLLEQDPEQPHFVPVMTRSRKYFADNPDTDYHRAAVREDLAYLIRGRRGGCHYLSFCLYAVRDNAIAIVADLSDRDLSVDPDGSFRIHLSAERPPGAENWIPLPPGVRSLVARQYFLDRKGEEPARFSIESLSPAAGSERPRAEDFARRLVLFRQAFERGLQATLRSTDRWMGRPNEISFHSGAGELSDLFPTPDNAYTGGWFSLGDDEALEVTVRPPDCRYWSIHLISRWLESLDRHRRRISINKVEARAEADGSFRFLIAARDPGHPNWLDTGGRGGGFFAFRWLQAPGETPAPECRLVPLPAPSLPADGTGG